MPCKTVRYQHRYAFYLTAPPPFWQYDGGASRTINAAQITLLGDVSDASSGVGSVTLQSDRYAGLNFSAIITGQRFEIELPLKTGANIITAIATDKAGNQTQTAITVNRDIAAAPRIEISAPQNGSSTQNDKVNLTGVIYSSQPYSDLRIEFDNQQIFPPHRQPRAYIISVSVTSPYSLV